MKRSTALVIATEAVRHFVQLGWKFDTALETNITLIHPYGVNRFATFGGVFIDILGHEAVSKEHYIRLCVLFPGQRIPAHHHTLREESFEVISGEAFVNGVLHRPGEVMRPALGAAHAVQTNLEGTAFIGVCHRDHLSDVHWEVTPLLAPCKSSLLPLTFVPFLPCGVNCTPIDWPTLLKRQT